MNVESVLPWCLSVALLAVRLAVAVTLSPAFSAYGVPSTVRAALTLALAALAFANRAPVPEAAAWAANPMHLLVSVTAEIVIGALLGMSVHLTFGALSLAGRLMDVQAGFAIGSVFDPVTRTSSNVLGSLLSLIGVTTFVATDAHLRLAQLVAQSMDVLPLGTLPGLNDPLQPILAGSSMFVLGLALAAPVSLALLLTDAVIAVASRNMQRVNVLVLAMPIKVIVGYGVLAVCVLGWTPLLRESFSEATALAGVR